MRKDELMDEIKVYVINDTSRANWRMRYLDPFTGKKVTRSTKTTKHREAIKVAAKWEAELQDGRYAKPSMASWSDFRDKYEQEVLVGLADKSEMKIIGVFNSIEKTLKPDRVQDITPNRLSTYVAAMRRKKRAESTIAGHMAHLHAALAYAVDWGFIQKIPELPKLQRVKRAKAMKGRPITVEEHERMLAVTAKVVEDEAAESWQYFQRGLWASGLRLDESLHLYWDRDDCKAGDCLEVQLAGRNSLLVIPAALEKGNEDRLLPMAPEFARFLEQTPEADRTGRVFKFYKRKTGKMGTVKMQWASTVLCDIGKAARVVVSKKAGHTKFASAHDLRRSFGQRWASRVMPQVLMELMRHKDITTTLKYYVGSNAQATAGTLWEADEAVQGLGPVLGPVLNGQLKKPLKNKLGN
jgi:integrase